MLAKMLVHLNYTGVFFRNCVMDRSKCLNYVVVFSGIVIDRSKSVDMLCLWWPGGSVITGVVLVRRLLI